MTFANIIVGTLDAHDSSSIGTVNHYAIFCSTPKSELSKVYPETTRPPHSYKFITKEKWHECKHQIETIRDSITIVCNIDANAYRSSDEGQ